MEKDWVHVEVLILHDLRGEKRNTTTTSSVPLILFDVKGDHQEQTLFPFVTVFKRKVLPPTLALLSVKEEEGIGSRTDEVSLVSTPEPQRPRRCRRVGDRNDHRNSESVTPLLRSREEAFP